MNMRAIGRDRPCFITFEAGPTHDGLEAAKALVSAAAEAGGDAVKFQMVDPDRMVADRTQPFSYEVLIDRDSGATETVTEPLYDLLARRALKPEEWRALKAHSDSLDLSFFLTVAFDDELALAAEMGCDGVKIASGDVNHLPFIRSAARTGMAIQLDTGSSTLGEVEVAVDAIRAEGNTDIVIHHCPSGYPARADGINLKVIATLRQMFDFPIAFSDHSPGWEMDIAAVTLGANLIEKTITTDRTTRSVEHMFSLEPADARTFVDSIRFLERALGTSRRIMSAEELERRKAVRRSVFLAAAAPAGTPLSEAPIEFRRPGLGIGPDDFEKLGGAVLKHDLPAGRMLTYQDLA